MKLISWNVNGLRACMEKGFTEYFEKENADIFCLQETKLSEGQLDFSPKGYNCIWNYAEKKGYSGTALFTRKTPISIKKGMGMEEHDHEGRVITAEFADFFMVCVYTPNSKRDLLRLDYRMQWEDDFLKYLLALNEKKPVIVTGDMNVAAQEIDIKNPKANIHNAGFTKEERDKFDTLLKAGFTDSFRFLNPEEVKYSWWSYMFHAREKNAGWRLDYFLVSDCLKGKIKAADIDTQIMGSDHAPVKLEINL